MIIYLVAGIICLTTAALALAGLLVDRSARENAWRRIAEERRWNSEHDRVRSVARRR